MFSSLTLILAAIVITVLLLGLGFAAGCHVGRLKGTAVLVAQPQTTPPTACSEYLPELGVCLETAKALELRRHAACEVMTRFRESAPPELLAAIDQLIVVTAKLGDQLHQINQATAMRRMSQTPEVSPPLRGIAAPAPAVTKSDMLSAEEMHEFTALAGEPTDSSSTKRRYPYDCYQQVFPLHGMSRAPNLALARTVRCHDISVHGISFFWPDDPDFDRVVVSLGSDDKPAHMLAEVMQSKAVYMHDEIRTLVGCRFIGRYQMAHVQMAHAQRPDISLEAVLDQPLSAAAALA
jgi:hypothetical protein